MMFEEKRKSMKDAYNAKYPENARFTKHFHDSLDDACEGSRQDGFQNGYQAGQAEARELVEKLSQCLDRVLHSDSRMHSDIAFLIIDCKAGADKFLGKS